MIDDLLTKNKAWAQNCVAQDPNFFTRLVNVQSPRALWIGCSDSRVPANEIVGMAPGEIFVHRNVANIVHSSDLNCLTVVQFAVKVLKVKDILVVGHYGCGGVRAALENVRDGMLPYWLRPIQDLIELNRADLDRIQEPSERVNLMCELNVRSQVVRLANTPILEEAWKTGPSPAIHGLVYDLHDGLLKDLNCSVDGHADLPSPLTGL